MAYTTPEIYPFEGQPGEYFVTICTRNRSCILGDIVDVLSDMGDIVNACWRKIPKHFQNTNVDTFQIMPNHVHGIIVIKNSTVGVGHVQPLQGTKKNKFQHVIPGSVGSVVRGFKAAVTKEVRGRGQFRGQSIWQRNYFEHIIRDDISHFFIEQYIELNPLLWLLDVDNFVVAESPLDLLQQTLKQKYTLSDQALAYVIRCEMEYRAWRKWEDSVK